MRILLTSLITVLAISSLQAQQLPPSAPRLVVSLAIDQLRTDYIEAFSALYGERGFKRLWKEGKVFRNAANSFTNADRSSAVASLYTGTTPSVHGIIGNRWMDTEQEQTVSCVDDRKFIGYYTNESSSAANLLTSTVTDELKIFTQGKGMVFSVSPFRDAAILGAGHAGNAAFWLNEFTGKWCGTTYYGEFPGWAGRYNDSLSVDMRIDDMVWSPVHPQEKYIYLPEWRDMPFQHKFTENRRKNYRAFLTSPFVNEEVNAFTEHLMKLTQIGKDNITDMLSLTYYAGNYGHKTVREAAMEMQDIYVRLDRSIAQLLDIIDKQVGLQNTLFVISSTGYTDTEAPDHGTYRIPSGEFYLNRCAALLNMYLMATYGDGKYVSNHYGQAIYLNHKQIEKKGLNLVDVQEKAAQFLVQFSGVNEVYSSQRLLLGAWTPEIERIRNGYHRKRSGDLLMEILPGWNMMNENGTLQKVVREANIPAPLIFIGYNLKPTVIDTPVTTEHVAPTLTRFMRIRAPNACKVLPLPQVR